MQFRIIAPRTIPDRSSARNSRSANLFILGIVALACTAASTGCQRGPGPDTVATVNGKPILRADLEARYQDTLGDSHQTPSLEQSDIVKLNIVRQLINDEILMQRAAKLNLTATDDEVQTKLDEIKAPYTQEQFNQSLAQKHLTLDQLKQEIRRSKTEEKLFNKEINSKIDVKDSDITAFYNAHKADYNLPQQQYHLAEIVVTSLPTPAQQAGNLQNSKAANDADAKKKIDALLNRIQSGEDFGMLAANFSERPDNAQSGGDMGFLTETQLHANPDVDAAISKLNPGQVTGVIPMYEPTATGKKQVGYAIFKLVDKESAGQHDLADPRVQQGIRKQLHDTRSQLLQNAYTEMLADQARVQNFFAEQIFKNGVQ